MTTPPVPLPELLTATDLSRPSLYRAIDRGEFPGYKLGGKYIVPRDAFEAWNRGEWIAPLRQPTPIRPVQLKRRSA